MTPVRHTDIDDVLGSRKARGSRNVQPPTTGRSQRPGLQTVVKARYRTLPATGANPGRGRASAVLRNIDYFTTRPDYEHAHRISRDLVMPEGRVNLQAHPEQRQALFERLAADRSKYLYHVVLSSGDRSMSEKDTERWATALLHAQGVSRYYLAVHAGHTGHTEHPHAHVVLPRDTRLTREDFLALRKTGDLEQQFHSRLYRHLEESWKERFADQTTSSGGTPRGIEESESSDQKKTIDIQFG
ncbi:hypothetical protein GCM10008949_41270 [Deinococcus humi]|nr:hypothetical protein GCM10008949_41270 [Deinococcus humi]